MDRKLFNNHRDNFKLIRVDEIDTIDNFYSGFTDYDSFLAYHSKENEEKNLSKTHVLINKENSEIVAYMSLLCGSIKLKESESFSYSLPRFDSYPSLKIAKLAVSEKYKKEFRGIGSFMVELGIGFFEELNNNGVACRFLIVDADVTSNPGVADFYRKLGFIPNQEYSKRTKQISMRLND